MRLQRIVLALGLAMLSATFIEGCNKSTDDKKTQADEKPKTPAKSDEEVEGPKRTGSPTAAATPTDAVRARTIAYAALLTQMRSRTVSVDETCAFFTCDSLTTRGEVDKLIKEQAVLGQKGWRITSTNVPASRMKTRPNGEVVALLEFVSEFACQTPGGSSDNDSGVAGCKTARRHPWKRECFNYVYTFVDVGGEWKRTGRAETTTIPC